MTQLCGFFFSGQGSYCSVRCRTTVVPLLARPPQLAPFSVHEPLGPITASQPSSIPRTPLGHDVARKRPDGRGAFPVDYCRPLFPVKRDLLSSCLC